MNSKSTAPRANDDTLRESPAGAAREGYAIHRWTRTSRASVTGLVLVQCALIFAPWLLSAEFVDRLTILFIYAILALMWNALAGYAGLVSVGQQAFFGLGAYAAVRIASFGVNPYLAIVLGGLAIALVSVPIASFMLRLGGGEFAIGMWVVAALAHLLVNLDTLVQGETGTSLISLQSYATDTRRMFTYWLALACMAGLGWCVFALLRSRAGSALQAIRDNEEAAASIGIRVFPAKRLIFVLSAFGCALAGALWLATAITFQPNTYFGVQWTAYMLFMVLVGGIGTYEGPIIGAVVFFVIETLFGGTGVAYLIGLGVVAVLFALVLPKGIWGAVEARFGIQLLPVGYWIRRGDARRS
ncbi:branched-chain amino acid ABC transporter permease [Pararobbsia silviterrae]|uniref:Branched-chain amino acid ABC transporter permease n=1 Tax=Pararobbsia silviterrae TaxID=1792498 RepID=A0A494XZA3_9BURK|nr:branched-chain amino acid ABC transporter permease [Pararobbsia silviterrae]RKP53494.1 branched-chain amino acid ABC transporter permease [Pararobbsia silviterrae]